MGLEFTHLNTEFIRCMNTAERTSPDADWSSIMSDYLVYSSAMLHEPCPVRQAPCPIRNGFRGVNQLWAPQIKRIVVKQPAADLRVLVRGYLGAAAQCAAILQSQGAFSLPPPSMLGGSGAATSFNPAEAFGSSVVSGLPLIPGASGSSVASVPTSLSSVASCPASLPSSASSAAPEMEVSRKLFPISPQIPSGTISAPASTSGTSQLSPAKAKTAPEDSSSAGSPGESGQRETQIILCNDFHQYRYHRHLHRHETRKEKYLTFSATLGTADPATGVLHWRKREFLVHTMSPFLWHCPPNVIANDIRRSKTLAKVPSAPSLAPSPSPLPPASPIATTRSILERWVRAGEKIALTRAILTSSSSGDFKLLCPRVVATSEKDPGTKVARQIYVFRMEDPDNQRLLKKAQQAITSNIDRCNLRALIMACGSDDVENVRELLTVVKEINSGLKLALSPRITIVGQMNDPRLLKARSDARLCCYFVNDFEEEMMDAHQSIVRDYVYRTPLSHAAYQGCLNPLRELLSRRDCQVNYFDEFGWTALHYAHDLATMGLLLSCRADINHRDLIEGQSVLHIKAKLGSPDMVRWLVERGANINLPNWQGDTPLMLAASNIPLPVSEAISPTLTHKEVTSTLETLLEIGTQEGGARRPLGGMLDVNRCNGWPGTTALHVAVLRGDIKTIGLLLDHGAAIDAATMEASSVIHYGVESALTGSTPTDQGSRSSHVEALRTLLEWAQTKNITPDLKDCKGRTPLHRAAILGGPTAATVIQLLLHSKANVNHLDDHLHTPLDYVQTSAHACVRSNNNDQCPCNKALLDAGALTAWSVADLASAWFQDSASVQFFRDRPGVSLLGPSSLSAEPSAGSSLASFALPMFAVSVDEVIPRLTHEHYGDMTATKAFLMSFRKYFPPHELLTRLLCRYVGQPYSASTAASFMDAISPSTNELMLAGVTTVSRPQTEEPAHLTITSTVLVQQRVLQFLKLWLQRWPSDFDPSDQPSISYSPQEKKLFLHQLKKVIEIIRQTHPTFQLEVPRSFSSSDKDKEEPVKGLTALLANSNQDVAPEIIEPSTFPVASSLATSLSSLSLLDKTRPDSPPHTNQPELQGWEMAPSFPMSDPTTRYDTTIRSQRVRRWAFRVAEQLTLLEHERLSLVGVAELLDQAWTRPDKHTCSPNALAMITRFNALSALVLSSILTTPPPPGSGPSISSVPSSSPSDHISSRNAQETRGSSSAPVSEHSSQKHGEKEWKQRSQVLGFWIDVAYYCKTPFKNMSSLLAIVSAFEHPSLYRLRPMWNGLSVQSNLKLRMLKKLSSHKDNMRVLRMVTKNLRGPIVPHVGVFVKDLFRIDEAPDYCGESRKPKKLEDADGSDSQAVDEEDDGEEENEDRKSRRQSGTDDEEEADEDELALLASPRGHDFTGTDLGSTSNPVGVRVKEDPVHEYPWSFSQLMEGGPNTAVGGAIHNSIMNSIPDPRSSRSSGAALSSVAISSTSSAMSIPSNSFTPSSVSNSFTLKAGRGIRGPALPSRGRKTSASSYAMSYGSHIGSLQRIDERSARGVVESRGGTDSVRLINFQKLLLRYEVLKELERGQSTKYSMLITPCPSIRKVLEDGIHAADKRPISMSDAMVLSYRILARPDQKSARTNPTGTAPPKAGTPKQQTKSKRKDESVLLTMLY